MKRYLIAATAFALLLIALFRIYGWAARLPESVLLAAIDGKSVNFHDDLFELTTCGFAVRAIRSSSRGNEIAALLATRLSNPDVQIRHGAVLALGEIGAEPAIIIRVLLPTLADSDVQVRLAAMKLLASFRPMSSEVFDALLPLCKDSDVRVRGQAITAIGGAGPAAKPAVPLFIDALADHRTRDDALRTVAAIGPEAAPAIPRLREFARNGTSYTRLYAAKALWKVEGRTETCVPALIDLLQNDPYGPIQRDAAQLLGEIGPPAAAAIPALQAAVAYTPKPAPEPKSKAEYKGPPILVPMSEAQFYPHIREAAATALKKIQAP